MLLALVVITFFGMLYFLISKNFLIQIISIKIVADCIFIILHFFESNKEELRAAAWLFYAMAIATIFMMMISGIYRATNREKNES